MLALIDGDIIAYKAAASAEERSYDLFFTDTGEDIASFTYKTELIEFMVMGDFDEDEVSWCKRKRAMHPKVAYGNANRLIKGILQKLETDENIVYLTGDTNFRNEVATIKPYKGSRPSSKPLLLGKTRDYLNKKYDTLLSEDEEADDLLSIEQWRYYKIALKANIQMKLEGSHIEPEFITCICTIDKDLDNTPGWHYNFDKDNLYWISEDESQFLFYRQLITGDSVDNIRGVRGSGHRKAMDTLLPLSTAKEMYDAVLELYKGDKEELLENARLLWMRREVGEMWEPPK